MTSFYNLQQGNCYFYHYSNVNFFFFLFSFSLPLLQVVVQLHGFYFNGKICIFILFLFLMKYGMFCLCYDTINFFMLVKVCFEISYIWCLYADKKRDKDTSKSLWGTKHCQASRYCQRSTLKNS